MAFIAPLIPLVTTLTGALTAGAGVLGAVSAIEQGNYQSAVAKNNAQVAERNAALESEASQREGMRSDREYAAALGSQLAAQGASGLDILGRTQLRTREAQQTVGAEARRDINARGTAAARGLLQDAANSRAEGKQAKTQGYLNAAGSILGAAAEISKGSSLATSKRKPRKPWDVSDNWYGK